MTTLGTVVAFAVVLAFLVPVLYGAYAIIRGAYLALRDAQEEREREAGSTRTAPDQSERSTA